MTFTFLAIVVAVVVVALLVAWLTTRWSVLQWIDAAEDLAYLIRYGNLGGRSRADRRQIRQTIKHLRDLQRKGIYMYGAINRLRAKGSPISMVLTAGGVTAGSVGCAASAVASAGLFGIVESAKDGNNTAVLHMEGVWLLPSFVVVTGLAIGDPIYVIPGTGVLTQTAAGNRLFAYSLSVLGAGAGQAIAKLAGSN